jgi:outer membrane protein OmpA-like peptidoglycan-associated protein
VATECPAQLTEQQSANLDPVNVIVYFDYDKANLTPEASNLITEAAARALANDVDTVVVSGHADRSGGSAYNQALSERRGAVVRDALVANGIAADKIRMESYGEDKPAKPTEDGVREPLNRRTEVVISFQ